MSAPGSTNPVRSAGFDHLQLNAGIFLKNFSYADIADAAALKTAIAAAITAGTTLLGMTRGGGTFNVTREMRNPDVDGLRYRYKGGDIVDSADPYLSTTLVEITPQQFADALGATATTSGKKTTVKMPTAIPNSAYLTNLCWIGDLKGEDTPLVLICLYNAINVADFTFTFQDKGEGSVQVEFHGCQADVNDYDEAPFEVVFFDKPAAQSGVT